MRRYHVHCAPAQIMHLTASPINRPMWVCVVYRRIGSCSVRSARRAYLNFPTALSRSRVRRAQFEWVKSGDARECAYTCNKLALFLRQRVFIATRIEYHGAATYTAHPGDKQLLTPSSIIFEFRLISETNRKTHKTRLLCCVVSTFSKAYSLWGELFDAVGDTISQFDICS